MWMWLLEVKRITFLPGHAGPDLSPSAFSCADLHGARPEPQSLSHPENPEVRWRPWSPPVRGETLSVIFDVKRDLPVRDAEVDTNVVGICMFGTVIQGLLGYAIEGEFEPWIEPLRRCTVSLLNLEGCLNL